MFVYFGLFEAEFLFHEGHDVIAVLRIEHCTHTGIENISVSVFFTHLLDGLLGTVDNRFEQCFLTLFQLFLGFLALLLISALHQRMQDAGLYTKYSMHELLLKLSKIHIARFHGRTIMQPISKEQRILFEQLGLKPPVG